MSDRDALHAAICANPDDDTARLVYADWLDENGQGKRAALIRAGVARDRCAGADTTAATVGRFLNENDWFPGAPLDWSALDPELADFQAAFTDQPGVKKVTPKGEKLPEAKGFKFEKFERGFFTGVNVADPDVFLSHADAIFRAAPVTSVHLAKLGAEHAKTFADAGYLAKLRHVGFGRVEPPAIRLLGDHADAAGVTSLYSDLRAGGTPRIEALGAGANWTAVTNFETGGFHFAIDYNPGRAVAAFLRLPKFTKLRHLKLEGVIEDGDAVCRAAAGLTELRTLHLDGNEIWESGTGAIARSARLKKLRHLFLDASSLDDKGAAATSLITAPNLTSLTTLHIDVFDGLSAKVLAGPSRGPTLRGLSFGNKLSAGVLTALAACPAVQGLWYLRMQQSDVTDTGLRAFARAAKFGNLAILHIDEYDVTEKSVTALAKCPALATVQDLFLHTKAVGAPGAKALTESKHLGALKRLNVYANTRGDKLLRQHFGDKFV